MKSNDEILAARSVIISDFLLSKGEKLIRQGSRWKHSEHNSLVLTGNWYFWNSRGKKGNAVDFLMEYYHYDFEKAVEILLEFQGNFVETTKTNINFENLKFSENEKRVIAYLCQTRKIKYEIIVDLVRQNKIKQEAETGNVLFLIRNWDGEIVGAEKVGTGEKRFKGVSRGVEYGFGFSLIFGVKVERIFCFESAIDLLSFFQIFEGKIQNTLLLSLSGLKENILSKSIDKYGKVEIIVCVDNDAAGKEFSEMVVGKYENTRIFLPSGAKDWNEKLKGGV